MSNTVLNVTITQNDDSSVLEFPMTVTVNGNITMVVNSSTFQIANGSNVSFGSVFNLSIAGRLIGGVPLYQMAV